MEQIRVSVIVPVYNVEKYLAGCLDSALAQTMLASMEIICVDDGSTDSSPRILADYASRCEQIRIIRQKNGGLSAARNTGIRAARGRYLMFLDSDDKLASPGALEELCDRAETDDLDMLFFEARMTYESEELRRTSTEPPDFFVRSHDYPRCASGQELYKLMDRRREYRPSAWLYLLRRTFLEGAGLLFPTGIYHEDEMFTLAAMALAAHTSCVHTCGYDRLWREDSIMSGSNVARRIRGNLLAARAMLDFARQRLGGADSNFLRRYRRHARAINLRGANQYAKLTEPQRQAFWKSIDPQERPVIRKQLRLGSRSRVARWLRGGVKRLLPNRLVEQLRRR